MINPFTLALAGVKKSFSYLDTLRELSALLTGNNLTLTFSKKYNCSDSQLISKLPTVFCNFVYVAC